MAFWGAVWSFQWCKCTNCWAPFNRPAWASKIQMLSCTSCGWCCTTLISISEGLLPSDILWSIWSIDCCVIRQVGEPAHSNCAFNQAGFYQSSKCWWFWMRSSTSTESCYKHNIDWPGLRRHLAMLEDIIKRPTPCIKKVTSVDTVCNTMNSNCIF